MSNNINHTSEHGRRLISELVGEILSLTRSSTSSQPPTLLRDTLTASASTNANNTSVNEEVRRLFPSVGRSSTRMCQTRKPKSRKTSFKESISTFKRNVCLVGPAVQETLKGKSKAVAQLNGFIMASVEFEKSASEEQIYIKLASIFADKLQGASFEILEPVSGNLVKPNLAPGTKLSGSILCNIFVQKPIYLRSLTNLDIFDENEISEDDCTNFVSTSKDIFIENELQNLPPDKVLASYTNSDEEQFEKDTLQAIDNSLSLNELPQLAEGTTNLYEQLRNIQSMINETKITEINIYRQEIFQCCLRAIRRKSFSPLNSIKVTFTDIDNTTEGAVDLGGPKREMFRLLLKHIKDNFFEGPENCKNLTLTNEALEKQYYLEAGKIIMLSLIHGGPVPNFFSETVFAFLLDGSDNMNPNIDEILNPEIKQEILDINSTTNLNELQDAISNSSFMNIAGISFVQDFERKDEIVKSAIKYYLIHRNRSALDQLKEGLNILNAWEKLRKFPNELRTIMCFKQCNLTSEKLKELFKVNLSEEGSNNRNIENRILAYWRDYLIDCDEADSTVSINQILAFTTGVDTLPALGFDEPLKLRFLHRDDSNFPKANTCSLVLELPVTHNSYEDFKLFMDYGIQNGMVFGAV